MHALVTWMEYKLTSDADQWLVLIILSARALPCAAMPHPALSCLALPWPAAICIAWKCPALPYPVPICPALSRRCLTLPCLQQLLLCECT